MTVSSRSFDHTQRMPEDAADRKKQHPGAECKATERDGADREAGNRGYLRRADPFERRRIVTNAAMTRP